MFFAGLKSTVLYSQLSERQPQKTKTNQREETVRYIQESERDRGVPVVPVDALLGSFGIEVRKPS